jgi:3-phenylpropionate/cinnamic acid dioxygenase small subunit
MSNLSLAVSPDVQRSLERFYAYEARLLDSREYQQWLALVSPDIQYQVPSRTNLMVDNRERGNEPMISVDRELERADSMGCPLREENYVHLMVRVERAFKVNSWSENPPARTRRIVGNVELMAQDGEQLSILNNFHMYYARPGTANYMYSGQRRDVLIAEEDSYRILRREVVLDYADIDYPTVGLLF